MPHPKYRPDIDGLRALAVLSVLLFHYFPNWLPGGFVGVDIFFVISGYLITGIILDNLDKGSFSFGDFYKRRARRILPSLLTILICVMAAGWFLLLPDEFVALGKHLASAASFLANISLWQEAGYFDTASGKKPLLHLWSLGIEEQFYIFWPLIIWAVWKRGRPFLHSAVAITTISFAVNLAIMYRHPVADFYSPASRFWELGVGAILTCLVRAHPAWLRTNPNLMSIAGFSLIAAALILIREGAPFPGWWALLPTSGAALIMAAGASSRINASVLSNRPAKFIGQISYPLYLWHWPLLSFGYIVCNGIPARTDRLVLFALSFPLAWLTYKFLEPRFRFKSDKSSLFTLVAASLLILIAGATCWTGFIPPRQDDMKLGPIVRALRDWGYPSGDFLPVPFNGITLYEKGRSGHATLFYGDSHMEHLAPRVDAMLNSKSGLNRAIFLTHTSCAPFHVATELPDCDGQRETFNKLLLRKDIDTVVIGSHWINYLDSHSNIDKFAGEIAAFLCALPKDKRVFVILDNPNGPQFDPNSFFTGSRFTSLGYRTAASFTRLDPLQKRLREAVANASHQSGAEVLDAASDLCRGDICKTKMPDGAPIYQDSNHMRPFFVVGHGNFLDVTLRPSARR